jgi:hypothetical protein
MVKMINESNILLEKHKKCKAIPVTGIGAP